MLDWRDLKQGEKLIYTVEEFGRIYHYPATVVGKFNIGTEDEHVTASSAICGGALWIDDDTAHMFMRREDFHGKDDNCPYWCDDDDIGNSNSR